MKFLKRLFNIDNKRDTNPSEGQSVSTDKTISGHSSEMYVVYCLLGKVDEEKDKLQYLPQWMDCAKHVDEFLIECRAKSVSSEQAFLKILSWEEDEESGYTKMKSKRFETPTGGTMLWCADNNQKMCEYYLPLLFNEIEQAKQEGKSHHQWLKDQFPEKNMTIKFYQNEIRGKIERVKGLKRNTLNDFIFRLSKSTDVSTSQHVNQEINIFISERFYRLKGQDEVLNFVKEIGRISKAVKVGMTLMPSAIYEKRETGSKKITTIRTLLDNDYGMPDELNFAPNPAGHEWVVISDKSKVKLNK